MTRSPTDPPLPPTKDALNRFLMDLRSVQDVLPLHDLTSLVARSGLSREDLEDFLTLEEATYAHHEVFRSPYLEVGCIGWQHGQRTPIHDHAESVCAVVVLDGVLTNIEYRPVARASLVRGETRRVFPGEIIDFERGTIHRMANEHLAAVFTLHVYSPPLPSLDKRIRPEAPVCSRSPGETP